MERICAPAEAFLVFVQTFISAGSQIRSFLAFDERRKMSDFKFNCPHCQQSLEAPEDMLGQMIECPACNGSIQLPEPTPAPQRPMPKQKIVTHRSSAPSRNAATSDANNRQHPQTRKPRRRILFVSLASALLLLVGLVAGIMVFRGRSQEVPGHRAEAVTTGNPPASTAQPCSASADHSTKILEVLSEFNDKTIVPSVLARHAQTRHRSYESRIESAGYDTDYTQILLNKFYLLTVASENKVLSSAAVEAEYEWSVTASPQLKDVVKVSDSDLFTKEAIYTCTTRTYSRLSRKSFNRDDVIFLALAKKCTIGAYHLNMGIPMADLELLTKNQPTLSDTITKSLDLDFLTTVSQPIMHHFSERHEDASPQFGTLKSTAPVEIRLRYNRQDREWVLYE
jgi:hypothetical protein